MFKFLTKFFEGWIDIEGAYNQCDKAVSQLQAYKANPESFTGQKKEKFDLVVSDAIASANQFVDMEMEGERNWPGIFREMHKYLATIYFQQGLIDKAERHFLKLKEYGLEGERDYDEINEEFRLQDNENSGTVESSDDAST
ncbi:hypothetical protein CMK22_10420 [Candidatus Poribacteria bacterium]|nr:hypothetical protein [Candidatus Poribacteria bacterium]